MTVPAQTRLPDGFAVQLDPRVQVDPRRQVLVGGCAQHASEREAAAIPLLDGGRLEVCDERSAVVARWLLDAGVAHPRPSGLPSHRDVTVVIAVRDDQERLARLLGRLRGLQVIVVDDGSRVPAWARGATVIRHNRPRGFPAARNVGLRYSKTEFTAFLTVGAMPARGWLELLLGHFSDPAVALVAPRVRTLPLGDGVVARYESHNSHLDRGCQEAPLCAGGGLPYVPGAAMIVRTAAVQGFDESLGHAEVTELCWRLQREGWHLRYEPVAQVHLDRRVDFRQWFRRNLWHGSGITALAIREHEAADPMTGPSWAVVACLSAALGGKRGAQYAAALTGVATASAALSLPASARTPGVVAGVVSRDLVAGGSQAASAAVRAYLPVTALTALYSARARRALVIAMIGDGIADWLRHRDPPNAGTDVGVVRHVLLKRLGDMAFGIGMWSTVVRSRSATALWKLR